MNTVVAVSVVVIASAILVSLFFLVSTLIQVRRTARQVELFLNKVNNEVNIISNIVENISCFTQKLNSPIVKIGAVVSGLVSMFVRSRCKK